MLIFKHLYIILGIIQGITEPLPISSSGHLFIFKNLINSNIKMGFGPICISPVAFQSQTKEFLDGFSRYMKIDNYLPKSPDTNEETDAEYHESSDI